MKKRIIPLLSALLTVTLLAVLALISGAQSTEPELKIAYCNLEFGQDTHILYAVTSEGVENVDDIELLVWKKTQTDYTTNPAVTLKKAGEETINGDKCVVFEFADLGAKNMTDYFYARAHVVIDGEDYYSPVNKYSVLQYAYNMLGKTGKTPTDDEDLKELLNNMLAYGASAQKYGKYRADHPANGDWHFVKIEGGTLGDGFDHGLYLADDEITITVENSDNFSYWTDGNGNELSTSGTFTAKVGDLIKNGEEKIEIKPVEVKASIGLKFTSNGDETCYVSGIGTCTDTDIVIPKTSPDGYKVTSIGEFAFKECSDITSVIIPDSVASIGNYAFYNCTSLTSITIPDSVSSIGSWTFYKCTSFTSVTIPDSVTSIGSDAFFDCTSLTSVTMGNSVTSIGYGAFSGCASLANVSIGNAVTNIDDYAFSRCTNLTSITIPESVTSIGYDAFSGCSSLTSITIPNSVTSIGGYAFYNCTSLESIDIPDGVTSIGYQAFYNTAYYNNNANWIDGVLYIGNHLIEAKNSISGAYTIKDGTRCIANHAFYACTSLTSITIPDGVTSIGSDAFIYCTRLTSIIIPESITSIGDDVFYRCMSLTSITVEDGNSIFHSTGNCMIKTEKKELIYGCQNSVIPRDGSVTGIGKFAFSGCTNLTNITIPDSVASIGRYAFDGCTSLTSVTIPDSVTSIGDSAFSGCSSLESITVESGNSVYHSAGNCLIETANKELILGCKNSVIPADGSVTSIGGYAFYNCTSLTSITIPDNVTSIGDYAFCNCTSLKKVYYTGTADDWSKISIGWGNDYLTSATRYYSAT